MQRHLNLAYATLDEGDVVRAVFADGQRELVEWFERSYAGRAFAYASGRAALRAVLRAAGIAAGDEVIVCGFTCLAVPEAVIYAGATPVYSDLAPGCWSSGVAEIEAVASSRTRAVILQHTFGMSTQVDEIVAFARTRGWSVIEDCALALGSMSGGSLLGRAGDAAIFSFEMTKTVTGGWGGMAVARDPQLAARAADSYRDEQKAGAMRVAREALQVLLSTFLFRPAVFAHTKYVVAALYKLGLFRMSGQPLASVAPPNWSRRLPRFHATLVSTQLSRLDRIRAHAQEIASIYRQWLEARGHCDVTAPRAQGTHLLRFPLLVREPDTLVRFLSRNGFELGRWFDAPVSPMPDSPASVSYQWGSCPRAEQVGRGVVNLPLHLRMQPSDARRLVDLMESHGVATVPLPK